jgi:hypothetical protein
MRSFAIVLLALIPAVATGADLDSAREAQVHEKFSPGATSDST